MGKSKIEWTDAIINRFWGYVLKTEGCWLWQAGCFTNGYGQFRAGNKKVRAHRFAYMITKGSIPSGKVICHKCDNPKCVNPGHLFIGTNRDNAEDRHKKGRDASGIRHGAHTKPEKRVTGELNGQAKLNPAQVVEIRSLRKTGLTLKELANQYGISKSQIGNIVRGQSWKGDQYNVS